MTSDTVLVDGQLTMDFACPGGHNRSMSRYISVSLSGACGFNDQDIKIGSISAKGNSKTEILFSLAATNYSDCWVMVNKLRKAIGSKSSPLNTIGHMKRVFNGSVLRVFDPDAVAPRNKRVVRYKVRAPNDTQIRANPPRDSTGDIPRRKDRPESSSPRKMQLPPDSSHVPFEVLLVPPGTEAPQSPGRHVSIPLADSPRRKPFDFSAVLQIDTGAMEALLKRPVPQLPPSLIKRPIPSSS